MSKEDIEKAKRYLDNLGYGTGSNFTLNTVAYLMVEYAANDDVIVKLKREIKELEKDIKE